MTLADGIAIGRALAVVPIWLLISVDERGAAFAIFILAALTDAIDGWVARRRAPVAHGVIVDPLADKVLVVGTAIALTLAGLERESLPLELCALLAVRETTAAVVRIAEYRGGIVRPADLGAKAKTAVEMVALAMLIAVRPPEPVAVAAVSLLWVAVVYGLVSLAQRWPHGRRSAL